MSGRDGKGRRRSPLGLLLLLVVLLLAAFYFSDGFGLGEGAGGLPTYQDRGQEPEPMASAAPMDTEKGEGETLLITVREQDVFINDDTQPVPDDALRQRLQTEARDGVAVTLRDEKAIKEVYDRVKALLDELHLSYVEE